MRTMVAVVFLMLSCLGGTAAAAPGPTTKATRSPRSYYRLPSSIVRSLERRKCSIQLKCEDGICVPGTNVESGEFFRSGRRDWAVVCSSQGTISVLAFESNRPASPHTVAKRLPFETWIRPVTHQYTLARAKSSGSALPPELEHQCIEINNDATSSLIYCFDDRRWQVFQGKE